MPYKTKNYHALSHEEPFSKHQFLDICRCVFNNFLNKWSFFQIMTYNFLFKDPGTKKNNLSKSFVPVIMHDNF